MSQRIECAGLSIDHDLHSLLVNEIAPGTGIDPDTFWQGLATIWSTLGPENERLLKERENLQVQIDEWHRTHQGQRWEAAAYETFLRDFGYLHPAPAPF
jgi:malate synthase